MRTGPSPGADRLSATPDGELLRMFVGEAIDYAIITLDPDGRVASWNAGAQRIKGYLADEIIGRHFSVFYPPEEIAAGRPKEMLGIARREGRLEREGWRVRKDGTRFWASVVISAIRDGEGRLLGYGKLTRDLTESHERELELKASEERFRVVFEHAAVPIATVSLEDESFGEILTANPAYAALLDRAPADLIGTNVSSLVHPDDVEFGLKTPLRRLARGDTEHVQFERRYIGLHGEIISALVTDARFVDRHGRRIAIGQILDISERKRFEQQLLHQADHDALTGLFNRRRFRAELERLINYAQRFGGGGAVLSLDLDGFKFVNDSLGHAAGDELVTRLAAAAKSGIRTTDVIARTGGDEFAVILPNADQQTAERVAGKLLEAIRMSGAIMHEERSAQVTTSIGITTFTADENLDSKDLLVEADIAMYDAKNAGKDCYAVYDRSQQRRERIATRQNWLGRLKGALAGEQFVLHAQPIVPIASKGIPRFELLLRLPDPELKLISPGAFLYNAERFGLIEEIDGWVMERAVRLLHEHHRAGHAIGLAFNVSAKTLNAGRLPQQLSVLLERYPIPAQSLTVEITETAAIANIEQARTLARDIRSLGCSLALDDFGAGFATFYYLKHLDFDFVKIDGEFIRHLPESEVDQLVVNAVVEIARGVGAETIAEFVQDDRTTELLRGLGVGYGQGYHLGRPGPISERLPQLPA